MNEMDRKGGVVDWNDLTDEEKASAVPLQDFIDKMNAEAGSGDSPG
jgi:hypothetical protein